MRKLHLVGLTTDRDGLIFTARKGSKSGGYIVPLDDKVLDAVAEARNGHPGAPDPRPDTRVGDGDRDRRDGRESSLTPREMQARLRAGRTIDEVAAEAGVDSDWVARFAVPILAEQAQVVELARGLTYAKPRLGDSSQPLNASVIQNLSEKGVFLPDDLADAGWSAFQLHDTVWMVRFRYRSRGRDQEAQWEIDVPTGRLQARNRHASDIGYVERGARLAPLHDEDGASDPAEPSAGASARPTRRPRATAAASARTRARAVSKARTAAATPVGKARARKVATAVVARAATTSGRATPATRARATKAPGPLVKSAAQSKPGKKAAGRAQVTRNAPAPAKTATARTAAGKAAAVKARPVNSAPVTAGAGKAGTAREPARRRPAKAGAATEVAPAPGAGGVRLAVAQVSTARVAASMASADRAPWATTSRSRSISGVRPGEPRPLSSVNGGSGFGPGPGAAPTPSPAPSAPAENEGRAAARAVPAFQPRPLPDGVEIERPRPRRPAGAVVRRASGERPAVILPAPRVSAPEPTPLPSERPVRRRLRSR